MQQLQKYKKTKLGMIPEDWKVLKLIQVCRGKPQYGASVSAIAKDESLPRYIRITDLNDDGSLRKDEWASISENDAKPFALSDGQILFARTGATVGKTYIYRNEHGKCAFAGYLIRFIIDDKKLDKEFLFHYTHSVHYWKWINSIRTEGVQPNVNAEQYSSMPIPYPSLKEQQKIASILSNIDRLIQKTKQIIGQTQILKKGLIHKLLTKGIGHIKFKKTELGEIPEEWIIINMYEIVKSYRNGIYKLDKYYGRGYPSLRMYNIREGKINLLNAPLLEVNDKELVDYGLEEGDILINRVNSVDLVGKAGIIKKGLGKLTYESKNIRMRVNNDIAYPEFINYFLNSNFYFNQIRSKVKAAIGQCTINQEDLNSLKLALPSITEQKRISLTLLKIEDNIECDNKILYNIKNLQKGLMQQLLTGIKRVKV